MDFHEEQIEHFFTGETGYAIENAVSYKRAAYLGRKIHLTRHVNKKRRRIFRI